MVETVVKGTQNTSNEVPVFPATVTEIVPLEAPAGTLAVMLVDVLAVTLAVTPLNLTRLLAAVVLKFVPESVTIVPAEPEAGENEVIVG